MRQASKDDAFAKAMEYGLHVDGFLAALLGGVIVRVTVLVLLALGPSGTAAQQS
ncbi:hypothetical protein [Streptomyces afghaniensis]|uniref:hypothetical protein n=1 Tax=Streptomyces afghaniensis TaxID=66865 RepID=UPI0037880E29